MGKNIFDSKLFGALSALVLLPLVALADPPTAASYNALCSYDSFCKTLKNDDGTFIAPKTEILIFLNQSADDIKKKAALVGVDPVAVAGAMLAENSLNVQIDDAIQNALVSYRIAPTASIMGKTFSIGFGQIHVETAKRVEPMLAKLENRKVRSDAEIADALLTPDGSFDYASGIIREAQDCYKENGFDVSKDPALLTTLYNLGEPCKRAAELKAKGGAPKPNYFGFFVKRNLVQAQQALDKKLASVDYQEPKGQEKYQYLDSAQLYKNPPHCSKEGAGKTGQYNAATSYVDSIPTTNVTGQYFRVVSRSVDCDLNSWEMIQDQSGDMGWIRNDQLMKKASQRPPGYFSSVPRFGCPPVDGCPAKLKELAGSNYVGADSRTELGLINLRYQAAANSKDPPDPKTYNPMCGEVDRYAGVGYGQGQNSPAPQTYIRAVGRTRSNMLAQIHRLRKKIAELYGDEALKNYDYSLSNFEKAITDCRGKCYFSYKEWSAVLKFDPGDGTVQGLSKLSQFYQAGSPAFWPTEKGPNETSAASPTTSPGMRLPKEITAMLRGDCTRAAGNNAEIKSAIDDMVTGLAQKPQGAPPMSQGSLNLGMEYLCAAIAQRKDHAAKSGSGGKDIVPDDNAAVLVPYSCGPNCSSSNQVNAKVAKRALKNTPDEQLDAFFQSALQAYAQYMGLNSQSSYMGNIKCGYDPFKNSEFVKKMIDSKCVDRVLTNDRFLVGSLRDAKVPVVEFETADPTTFSLQVKTTCGSSMSPANDVESEQ